MMGYSVIESCDVEHSMESFYVLLRSSWSGRQSFNVFGLIAMVWRCITIERRRTNDQRCNSWFTSDNWFRQRLKLVTQNKDDGLMFSMTMHSLLNTESNCKWLYLHYRLWTTAIELHQWWSTRKLIANNNAGASRARQTPTYDEPTRTARINDFPSQRCRSTITRCCLEFVARRCLPALAAFR